MLLATTLDQILPRRIVRPLQRSLSEFTIHHDNLCFSFGNFSSAERKYMKEVRAYSLAKGVETARILNRFEELLQFQSIEERCNVGLVVPQTHSRIAQNIPMLKKLIQHLSNPLKNVTFIHSHNDELPISGTDVILLVKGQLRKIIATTPKGNYSCLDRQKPLLIDSKYLQAAIELQQRQHQKARELGLLTIGQNSEEIFNPENVSTETFNVYKNYSIAILTDFANKFGMNFTHNLI